MFERSGPGWRVSARSHLSMLIALYIRDLAGIVGAPPALDHGAGPLVSALQPAVKPRAASELGPSEFAELCQEWHQWWRRMVTRYDVDASPETAEVPEAALFGQPDFDAFRASPALQKLLRAHYGAAHDWANERRAEYHSLSREHAAAGRRRVVEMLVQERSMEVAAGQDIEINLVELPLAERRAWLAGQRTVILSQDLPHDENLLRSYLEPMVRLIDEPGSSSHRRVRCPECAPLGRCPPCSSGTGPNARAPGACGTGQ